ncbi:hypothetical protein [Nocardioides ferulae]|uniref:hypothetical protein n=1 Tax=Nocardioides ferulae TaxID=2340821 RepID=UPI0013DE1CCA|nr:hypothetical protein [Nocardioides ferulae]
MRILRNTIDFVSAVRSARRMAATMPSDPAEREALLARLDEPYDEDPTSGRTAKGD